MKSRNDLLVELLTIIKDTQTPLLPEDINLINEHVELLAPNNENDIDINSREESLNTTPLELAAVMGHTDAAKLLLEAKASVDAKDKDNCTALYFACFYGHHDMIKILIDAKSDLNVKNIYGQTPLMIACREGNLECVKVLIDNKAEINIKTPNGESALSKTIHKVFQSNDLRIMNLLFENGAIVTQLSDLSFFAFKLNKWEQSDPTFLQILKRIDAQEEIEFKNLNYFDKQSYKFAKSEIKDYKKALIKVTDAQTKKIAQLLAKNTPLPKVLQHIVIDYNLVLNHGLFADSSGKVTKENIEHTAHSGLVNKTLFSIKKMFR